jgi:hypothetical protein
MAVSPARLGKGKLETIAPWGFEAHLTRLDDPDVDLVHPCGAWFQPPPGRYRARVEGNWQISPYSVVLGFAGRPFRNRGLVATIPVADGGRVTLPKRAPVGPQLVLRLLHAGSYLEGEFPRWEVSRRAPSREVGEGLLMPVGPTIAALWDNESQSYTELSRPFEVKGHQTVEAPLERPEGVAHFVAQLQRQASATADYGDEVSLQRAGKRIPPHLKVSAADRVYAVWYDLAPGMAELRAESERAFLEPTPVELHSGKIERLIVEMRPRPTLDFKVNK